MFNKLLIVIFLLVELYVIGYAIFMTFLLNAWIESDSFAQQATELDWWRLAARRIGVTLLFASLISSAVYYINRLLVKRRYLSWPMAHRYSAIFCFCLMMIAALAGAVTFVINKPFI